MKSILSLLTILLLAGTFEAAQGADQKKNNLTITWNKNYLEIHGDHLPGKIMRVHYLEAYCRAGSTDREWRKTTIAHKTELISASKNKKEIHLKSTLKDGVTVMHTITVGSNEITFQLVANNPTKTTSLAHWAQPCVRVDKFTGRNKVTYLSKSFIFLDGKLARMPTRNWATKARYVPGQVWAPQGVNRNDVNPRPLSGLVPDNGLIGCFSADEKMLYATAWEPYQELFQGVATCLHSDFRIGGLKPGETKKIRGKIYLMKANVDQLLKRYQKDFPEHFSSKNKKNSD
ncbi:FIG00927127: hypothetical protein [hydrothermal vent metagenome]|uniref:Uncharacterized protein n=1 Tax=hydrothermal vent metagenome TaxID=652676 RepID=A0A3B1DL89_9ZZZZ